MSTIGEVARFLILEMAIVAVAAWFGWEMRRRWEARR